MKGDDNMYKAVVFDFDGTVIDTEKYLFDLINTHLKIHQVAPISLEFYKQFIGGEATELHTYLEDAIGFKNKEKFIINIIKQVLNCR